ncbi:MAG: dienelactone hydrolase family protein [Pseudomonadota bacterium]
MTQEKPYVPSQAILDLYDGYAHGQFDRREFFRRASAVTAGTVSAAAIAAAVMPRYAQAMQVAPDDARIDTRTLEYASPNGAGKMSGLLAHPAGDGPWPAVVVIHENRGLNPYIEDVARRLAVAGYMALAPDALFPLGGYPGNDDDGRALQRKRDREQMFEDFVAAAQWLMTADNSTGRVGSVGFCYGGGVSNALAVRLPELGAASCYYGRQVAAEEVPAIAAPLQIHMGELDTRINAGWPDLRDALDAHGKNYEAYVYPKANHGFHNDTTPRYDQTAAEKSWQRTLRFFDAHLR